MNRSIAMLAVAGVLLAAPAAVGASATGRPDTERAEVQKFVNSYIDAQNKADATALMELVSRKPGASSINEGRLMRGWGAIRDAADEMASAVGTFKLALGTMDISSLGPGFSMVVAPFTLTVGSDDDPEQIRGALTLILEKANGKWKILHEHQSAEPPERDDDQDDGE
jgi:ketosteroid isomerase-like protein